VIDIKKIIEQTKDMKILYVEDNKESRDAMLSLLHEFFNDIVVAVDGEDGLKKFTQSKFDLVFTDINMPKMNGLEMSRQIKEIDVGIPIVVISAHTDTDLLLESIDLGIDKYLLKPIDAEQFTTTISELINELAKGESAKKDQFYIDNVTKLYNEYYFDHISEDYFANAKRYKHHLGLLIINIYNIEKINHIYGRIVTNNMMSEVAHLLRSIFRAGDVLIKTKRDNFLIIMPHTNVDGVRAVAKKVEKSINNSPKIHEELSFELEIKIGGCEIDLDNDLSFNHTLERAKDALDRAIEGTATTVIAE